MTSRQQLTPRKQPLQRRSKRTVEAILEAAAQVFEREGYARTTTDRIAERAGVSIGSLYQYFPNKNAVLVALLEAHVEESMALVRGLLDRFGTRPGLEQIPLQELLEVFLNALVDHHRVRPRLQRLLLVETPLPEEATKRIQRWEDELICTVGVLLDAHPEARVTDPSLCSWMLVHLGESLVHEFVVHPPPGGIDQQTFVRETTRLVQAWLAG